jgi:hypothetical protein
LCSNGARSRLGLSVERRTTGNRPRHPVFRRAPVLPMLVAHNTVTYRRGSSPAHLTKIGAGPPPGRSGTRRVCGRHLRAGAQGQGQRIGG